MKKCILISLMMAIIPTYVFGASARYNQLVSEKQRKIEELEKCSGNINGWKIAGISTLGLTAVGVAGNIALSNTQKDYDKKIEKTDKQISDTQENIEKLEEQKRLAAAEQMAREQCKRAGGTYNNSVCTCNETGKVYQNGNCVPKQYEIPKQTPTTNNCTETAKQNDEHVVRAEMNGETCEIIECDTGYQPTSDKQHCELKVVDTETDCTADAQKTDKNVIRAVKHGEKCEVTACAKAYTPSSDKTKCVKKTSENKKTSANNNHNTNQCIFKGKEYKKDERIDLNCFTDDTDCTEIGKFFDTSGFGDGYCECFDGGLWLCYPYHCKDGWIQKRDAGCVKEGTTEDVCSHFFGDDYETFDLEAKIDVDCDDNRFLYCQSSYGYRLDESVSKAQCECANNNGRIDWSCRATECKHGYDVVNGKCAKIAVNTNKSRNASNAYVGNGCDRALALSGVLATSSGKTWSVTYHGGILTGSASCNSDRKCSCSSGGSDFTIAGCKIKPTHKWVMVNPVALPFCETACAKHCADAVKTNAGIRKTLFEASEL